MLIDFLFLFGEGLEPLEALLLQEPVLVAGTAPVGDVLMGDGVAPEEVGHDGFGFGQTVHPWEDGAAEFAVVEAVVELFAEGVGEAGDLAYSGGHSLRVKELRSLRIEKSATVSHLALGFISILQNEEKLTVRFYVETADGVSFMKQKFGKTGRNGWFFATGAQRAQRNCFNHGWTRIRLRRTSARQVNTDLGGEFLQEVTEETERRRVCADYTNNHPFNAETRRTPRKNLRNTA